MQNSVFKHGPQQSPPSKLQFRLFASSSQNPLLNNGFISPYPLNFESKHEQSEQYFVMTQEPQQSPPSKLHSGVLVSS